MLQLHVQSRGSRGNGSIRRGLPRLGVPFWGVNFRSRIPSPLISGKKTHNDGLVAPTLLVPNVSFCLNSVKAGYIRESTKDIGFVAGKHCYRGIMDNKMDTTIIYWGYLWEIVPFHV